MYKKYFIFVWEIVLQESFIFCWMCFIWIRPTNFSSNQWNSQEKVLYFSFAKKKFSNFQFCFMFQVFESLSYFINSYFIFSFRQSAFHITTRSLILLTCLNHQRDKKLKMNIWNEMEIYVPKFFRHPSLGNVNIKQKGNEII